jgi:hypothetical protein
MADPNAPTSPLAIASLVLGGLAVLTSCCCYGLPFNLIGLILGIVAITQTGPESGQGGRGLAIGGVACSLFSMVLAVALLFLGVAGSMMNAMNQGNF